MTRDELLSEVLQGVLLIVGDYRGSHAEAAGYVDKKSGEKINYIRAIHLIECCWHGHIGPVLVTQRFPEVVQTVGASLAAIAFLTIPIAGVWVFVGRSLGRKQRELTDGARANASNVDVALDPTETEASTP